VWIVEPMDDRTLVWLGPDQPLPEMVPGLRVFRSSDPAVDREVQALIRSAPARRKLHLELRGDLGSPAILAARTEDGLVASVTVEGQVERALRTGITHSLISEKLGRLGDTPFELGNLKVDLPEGSLLPLSALNRARRAIVEAILAQGRRPHPTRPRARADLPPAVEPAGGLFVLCRDPDQVDAALDAGADAVILDYPDPSAPATRPFGVALPQVHEPGDEGLVKSLIDLDPDFLLIRSLAAIPLAASRPCVADASFGVTNSLSAAALLGRGVRAFTPGADLEPPRTSRLLQGSLAPYAEVVIHQHLPLFHTKHCLFAAHLSEGRDCRSCGRPCRSHTLSICDRKGVVHPVRVDGAGRSTVFHGTATTRVAPAGVRRIRIELLDESAEQTRRLVQGIRDRM
jgi:putative protease